MKTFYIELFPKNEQSQKFYFEDDQDTLFLSECEKYIDPKFRSYKGRIPLEIYQVNNDYEHVKINDKELYLENGKIISSVPKDLT